MNATVNAVRAGARRGLIELRISLTTTQDILGYVVPTLIFVVVLLFMRNATVPGTTFSLGSVTLPSLLGMGVALSGLATIAQQLTVDREDGTLLRAKATPHGMLGYLIGKIILIAATTIVGLVVQLVAGLLIIDGLVLTSVNAWLTLTWVLVVGLIATMPIGAVLGALFDDPRALGFVMLLVMGLAAISGIFYPITALPGWLQVVGQIFPMYWLGLGMRSALLPAEMAAVEIGGSWRHAETLTVLGVWAVLGLIVAPIVLRRMARRESGSAVERRRQKALQRAPF
jgi:ABC-type multidrug transport system, permease component